MLASNGRKWINISITFYDVAAVIWLFSKYLLLLFIGFIQT